MAENKYNTNAASTRPIRNVQRCKLHPKSSCTFGKYYPPSRNILGGKTKPPELNLDPSSCGGNALSSSKGS
uniref:Uncharacterized protein n=1 Tax=Anguilla anguilla TaxID=7936 RepID=A0A0E9QGM4_ANGAN